MKDLLIAFGLLIIITHLIYSFYSIVIGIRKLSKMKKMFKN